MVMDMMTGQAAPTGDLASALGMGGQAPPPGGGGGDPESTYAALIDSTQDASTLVNWAKMAVTKAIQLEPDHEDTLVLEDTNSRLQKYLATQQRVQDSAAGPGIDAKALRKAYS